MAKPSAVKGIGPESRVRDAARAIVTARLRDVGRYLEPVAGSVDPDAVHDMRVATRRLRAAIKLLGGDELGELAVEVKRLADALGQVRDLDVQRAWVDGKAERVAALLARRRGPRTRELRDALRRWSQRAAPRLRTELRRIEPPGRLDGKRVRNQLRKRFRRVATGIDDVWKVPSPERAHALRIAVKKLRYELEVLEHAYPKEVAAALGTLAPLQEALGDLHDADVRLDLLRRERAGRAVVARAARERDRLAAGLRRELARWRRQDVLAKLRRELP